MVKQIWWIVCVHHGIARIAAVNRLTVREVVCLINLLRFAGVRETAPKIHFCLVTPVHPLINGARFFYMRVSGQKKSQILDFVTILNKKTKSIEIFCLL